MANSLGIDFNPQPAYGSDPFSPIVEGANLGFGLVQNVQQIKKQQQDQQQEVEKMKLLKFGQIADLYDKVKNPINKAQYWNDTIRPAAKQVFGADLPDQPTETINNHLSALAELYELKRKGKLNDNQFIERSQGLYINASKAGDTDAAAAIKNAMGFKDETIPTTQTPQYRQTQLRKEYTTRIKDMGFLNRRDAYQEALNAEKNPSVVNDIGLIYAVARMRDPGGRLADKDVQEAAKAGALPQELQALWNSVFNNKERLSDFSRKSLIDSVKQLYESHNMNYKSIQSTYRDLALENGLDPSQVVIPFDVPDANPNKQGSTGKATLQWNPETGKLEPI